ncbi:armadillo-type protein [Mycena rosella]|uniref:Armadillo-type protein n=1 Tax=Mycena rosella TaxID=1033263 RepID=A0AAD7G145_MYCRO|nr:armadillo-type protein [Mycena rosella]
MPPLQQFPSQHSILSWWSDSNPPGPTIPLHTLAKPLLKLLYHRQAVALISQDTDAPLSTGKVEILISYLSYKYISDVTKARVLQHLSARAKSLLDAGAIIRANTLELGLLDSEDLLILRQTCSMLGNIARHEPLNGTVVASTPLTRLVSLARYHLDKGVQSQALFALCWISRWSESAPRSARVLDHIMLILDSPDTDVLVLGCRTLGNIAGYSGSNVAVLQLRPCIKLVQLLRHPSLDVRRHAMYTLCHLSSFSDSGGRDVLDAGVLQAINRLELLGCSNSDLLSGTCWLLGSLRHRGVRVHAIIHPLRELSDIRDQIE